jgi:hypothetical protein
MDQLSPNEKAIRHLGICRQVTRVEATIDKRILKCLYTRGYYEGRGEGVLANGAQAAGKDDPAFQASLARLAEYGMVEIRPARYGDARRVALTPQGQGWAEELVSTFNIRGN